MIQLIKLSILCSLLFLVIANTSNADTNNTLTESTIGI